MRLLSVSKHERLVSISRYMQLVGVSKYMELVSVSKQAAGTLSLMLCCTDFVM